VNTFSEPQEPDETPDPARLQLTLFVSGASPVSSRAERRLRDLCDRHAPVGYDLNIIDIHAQPALVVSRGVLAVPTLIKDLPLPVRVLIGDFTDGPRVLAALGLPTQQE
jgi:circadian clock protein KaiB